MSPLPADVLLTHGTYLGTLAAARLLGRAGHRVTVADPGSPSPAARSRHVAGSVRCPEPLDFNATADWLEAFGRAHPGTLLYPCSDDMAWVMAAHQARLVPHYVMLQPSLDAIDTLLNKQRLYTLCDTLGIATPETRYPDSEAQLEATVGELQGQWLVKPKTQIGLAIKRKACIAEAGPALIAAYRGFRSDFRYVDAIVDHDPALRWPMLQRFDPAASTQTISIAGFRSRDGRQFHVLSSQKVLQFPIRIGIGLCFDPVAVDPRLADSVRRICEATGYFGAFEVEFIRSARGSDLLMDFNPRYYGQMQMEISRGLPVPTLVACDASGLPLPALGVPRALRIAHRWQLWLVMTTQALAGRITWSERRRWLDRTRPDDPEVIDSVHDPDDPAPSRAHTRTQVLSYLRHPRAAFRALFGSA